MTTYKKLQPEIRFAGFTDDWEQRKLGDVLKIKSGMSQKGIEEPNGKYPILATGGEIGRTNIAIYNKESVLIGRKGTIDKPYYMNTPFWTVDTLFYTELSSHIFGLFIYYLFQKIDWKNYDTSTGVPSLTSSTIHNIDALIPKSKEEQTAIGNFFKQLDDTIALHQRTLEKYQKLKISYLEKMFPKENEQYPELRFPNFTDAWEQRKLGDITNHFEYGLNAQAIAFDGKHKYIRITDIDDENHSFSEKELTSPDINFANSKNYKLSKNDILFARTGASVGKTYLYNENDGELYFAGFLIRGKIKDDFNSYFIFQNTLTNRFHDFISITSQRSGQPGINAKEYASFELFCPSLPEQTAIGNFFKQLDDTIALHQREVEKYKKIKQSYLEKMFI